MLTYGRPKLSIQALKSLRENTDPNSYDLTLLDDDGKLGTGIARNKVIDSITDRGKYLYLSDNDVYFLPKWLDVLIEAYEWAKTTYKVVAMGAYNHPYNPSYRRIAMHSSPLNKTIEIGLVHALATQSWLWSWEDWEKYGPFITTAAGKVCQSEDITISTKIKKDGRNLAVLVPPMLINCGLTNSEGNPIPGQDVVRKEWTMKGVIRE